MYDYGKLRGRIAEKNITFGDLAASVGVSPNTIGKKMSGKSEWSQGEILSVCDALEISKSEISDYFFCRVS